MNVGKARGVGARGEQCAARGRAGATSPPQLVGAGLTPGAGGDEKLGGGRPHSVCPVPFRAGRHRGDPQQN